MTQNWNLGCKFNGFGNQFLTIFLRNFKEFEIFIKTRLKTNVFITIANLSMNPAEIISILSELGFSPRIQISANICFGDLSGNVLIS